MTDTTPELNPQDEPTNDSWGVSDSANELGVEAFEENHCGGQTFDR